MKCHLGCAGGRNQSGLKSIICTFQMYKQRAGVKPLLKMPASQAEALALVLALYLLVLFVANAPESALVLDKDLGLCFRCVKIPMESLAFDFVLLNPFHCGQLGKYQWIKYLFLSLCCSTLQTSK